MNEFWSNVTIQKVADLIDDTVCYEDSIDEATFVVCHTLLAFYKILKGTDTKVKNMETIYNFAKRHKVADFYKLSRTDAEVFIVMAKTVYDENGYEDGVFRVKYKSPLSGNLSECLAYPRMRVLEFKNHDEQLKFLNTDILSELSITEQIVLVSDSDYDHVLKLMAKGDNVRYKELQHDFHKVTAGNANFARNTLDSSAVYNMSSGVIREYYDKHNDTIDKVCEFIREYMKSFPTVLCHTGDGVGMILFIYSISKQKYIEPPNLGIDAKYIVSMDDLDILSEVYEIDTIFKTVTAELKSFYKHWQGDDFDDFDPIDIAIIYIHTYMLKLKK